MKLKNHEAARAAKVEAILSALKGDSYKLQAFGKNEILVIEPANGGWVKWNTTEPIDISKCKHMIIVKVIYD